MNASFSDMEEKQLEQEEMMQDMKMMKEKETQKRVALPILLLLAALLGCLFYLLLGEELTTVIRWWGILVLLGISVLPITLGLFPSFQSGGYLFSKVIGLGVMGYLMWLFSSLKLLKFSTLNSIFLWAVFTGLLYGGLFFLGRKKGTAKHFAGQVQEKFKQMLCMELVFFALLILFTYLFGNKVIGAETEKAMDLAFMNVIARTEYFPPVDVWASGTTLNYYYFGQYLITFLSKISFTAIGNGYCLGISTLAAFCFMLVYTLASEMMRGKVREVHQQEKLQGASKLPVIAGILSAAAVTLAGNMHYILFGKIVPMVWDILQLPGEKPSYWFASSTRYIGYIPDNAMDKTISEFPAYSFLIGDLHAHVIDIIFVLLILAILFSWLIQQKKREVEESFLLTVVKQPVLLMLAFLLGICSMTNYWDFPIYYVVCGSVILAGNLLTYGKKKEQEKTGSDSAIPRICKAVGITLAEGALMLLVILLVSMPFSLKFDKMMMGIRLCTTHSAFYQLVILWGFPVILVTGFFIALLHSGKKWSFSNGTEQKGRTDLFCLLLGTCAIGLVLLPEIIYVKDIYEEGFPRANTMFKLTYEAFILFGIAMGYIITRFLFLSETRAQKKGGIAALICLCLTTGYFFTAAHMWLGEYWNPTNYQGIDAETYYAQQLPLDYDAALWLKEHAENDAVVLEADGDSYTDYERISVLTGLPTVLGWHTHEWLWKNGPEFMQNRQEDIQTIYTSQDQKTVSELIKLYKISYIYIGEKEYEKYGEINKTLLEGLGRVVYSSYSKEQERENIIIETAQ